MRLLLSARLARAVAKGDGGRDSEQPAKNRGGEHDPHERRVRRADDPVQLHGSRIRGDENDKHGQGRHREPCPRIKSGVAAVADQPATPRFGSRFRSELSAWVRWRTFGCCRLASESSQSSGAPVHSGPVCASPTIEASRLPRLVRRRTLSVTHPGRPRPRSYASSTDAPRTASSVPMSTSR